MGISLYDDFDTPPLRLPVCTVCGAPLSQQSLDVCDRCFESEVSKPAILPDVDLESTSPSSTWQAEVSWPFQNISWPVPTVINVVSDLEAEYANVANDFLAFVQKAGEQIRLQQQQIADLETEIRGLEHTNELHLATINQQAAAIKELEEERLNLLIRQDFLTRAATRRGEIITILKARILALTAPDSGVQTQPAESEPVSVRKVAQSMTDSS